jgi:hypothetical protein
MSLSGADVVAFRSGWLLQNAARGLLVWRFMKSSIL